MESRWWPGFVVPALATCLAAGHARAAEEGWLPEAGPETPPVREGVERDEKAGSRERRHEAPAEGKNEASREREDWYETSSQLGVTVGLPFYDERVVNGDMTVDIRYGRKLWWFVPYFAGGFRQSRINPSRASSEALRKNMDIWHMTLGLRVEIPASRHLLPFVGFAGELGHYGFQANTSNYCHEPWYPNAWRCYERYRWKAGRALKAQAGILYKPYPDLALEIFVEKGRISAPEFFTRTVTFITPTLGFAWHH